MTAPDLLANLDELTATCAQITATIARINGQVQAMQQQPAAPAEPQKLLTAADLVERLQISKSQAYQLLRSGELATVHLGRSVRMTKEDLQAYLDTCRSERSMRPWYEKMVS